MKKRIIITPETRDKIRKAQTGHVVSVETRAKISETKLRSSKSISFRLMGHVVTEETRAKLRAANLGKHPSEETKRKMIIAGKRMVFTAEHRTNLSKAGTGHVQSEEHKRKSRLANLGKRASGETKAKVGAASKQRWQFPAYKDRVVKAIRQSLLIHPNKPETIIMNMLDCICPGQFKFVGDGEVIIAGKNPDFININGHKQIIELFGDYWHGKRAGCYERTEKGRIELFKQYGFDTLIIWESELKYPSKVADRISSFTRGNCFDGLL